MLLLRCMHHFAVTLQAKKLLFWQPTHLVHGDRRGENDEYASNEPCCNTETARKVRQGLVQQQVAICTDLSIKLLQIIYLGSAGSSPGS
jgi:hypothetical protein